MGTGRVLCAFVKPECWLDLLTRFRKYGASPAGDADESVPGEGSSDGPTNEADGVWT
jgi:hypothetical protein